ncbi:hypothetical protein JW960_25445 [candidate division KSB1 bacterium]|nr:hypothetical protein [candidate division KSB1 bacterium]
MVNIKGILKLASITVGVVEFANCTLRILHLDLLAPFNPTIPDTNSSAYMSQHTGKWSSEFNFRKIISELKVKIIRLPQKINQLYSAKIKYQTGNDTQNTESNRFINNYLIGGEYLKYLAFNKSLQFTPIAANPARRFSNCITYNLSSIILHPKSHNTMQLPFFG